MKAGIKKVISVNVTPSQEEIVKTYTEKSKKRTPSIFDFIFGSFEAMQRKLIQEAISLSDIVIHPEFHNADWTDFSNIDYYIEQGWRAARLQGW